MSDWELQESFQGVLPSLQDTDAASLASYEALNEKGLLGPSPDRAYVFALLQNPLLAKYGFDPADFIIGAELAFKKYTLASSSLEFQDFANGKLKTSAAATFVRQSVCKLMYDANIAVTKQWGCYGPVNVKINLELKDLHIYFAKTSFIESSDDDSVVSNEWDIKSFSDVQSPEFRKSFFRYPVGSVVATVGVKFMCTETYREHWYGAMPPQVRSLHTAEEWKERHSELHTRTALEQQCMFEGCISGHVPLDWKIVF